MARCKTMALHRCPAACHADLGSSMDGRDYVACPSFRMKARSRRCLEQAKLARL